MRKIVFILASFFIIMVASTSYAMVEVTVSDNTFVRSTGAPVTETKTFPGVSGKAIVKLYNGGVFDNNIERVSSSTVAVNGQAIFGPSNFNQNVSYLEQEVVLLEGQNTLQVTLKSKPGGKVTIRIIQDINAEAAAVVGSSGGTIEVIDPSSPIYGTKCVIPENAVTGNKVIYIKKATNLPADSESEKGIGQVIDFGPNGTTFSQPVTIQIPYSKQETQDKHILSENKLYIYNFNQAAGLWLRVSNTTSDPTTNMVSASVNHFSYYEINGDRLYDSQFGDNNPDPRKNILFIHGIQLEHPSGYDNAVDGWWGSNNDLNAFGNMPAFLKDEYRVWYYSYDSWEDIPTNALNLVDVITKIKNITKNNSDVIIIAHSEGGLVARGYLESPFYANDVKKILLLGTPNHGSNIAETICTIPLLKIEIQRVCDKVKDLPAMKQMKQPNEFLDALNSPTGNGTSVIGMPHYISLLNVFSGDILTLLSGVGLYGDAVVTKNSAQIGEFADQGIVNKELDNKLYHIKATVPNWENGIADIVKTTTFPACDNKDSCNHPTWLLTKEFLTETPSSLSSGLVAYYPFSGNANDASGNGNNGTENGATPTTDRFGGQNSAYSFNGVNNFIEIPNATSLNPGTVSISAWFNIKDFLLGGSFCNNQWQILVFKKNSLYANFENYTIYIGNGVGNVQGSIGATTSSAGGQQVSVYSSEIVQPNKWYHVVTTITSEEIKLYVNGVLQDRQPTGFPLDHGDRPLYFGRTGEWCEGYFNGSLDEVRIYNRVLSDSEIQSLASGLDQTIKVQHANYLVSNQFMYTIEYGYDANVLVNFASGYLDNGYTFINGKLHYIGWMGLQVLPQWDPQWGKHLQFFVCSDNTFTSCTQRDWVTRVNSISSDVSNIVYSTINIYDQTEANLLVPAGTGL